MNPRDPKAELDRLLETTRDSGRPQAVSSRRAKGYRTARENLEDLCDPGSFVEHGQLAVAEDQRVPVVIYTEGGGGRPGDTDVTTQIAGLDLPTFARFAGLAGKVPRIAVNNGYCFAGNAALFGSADLRLATRTSWIGMADRRIRRHGP